MKYHTLKGDHNEKSLQSTEQQAVPKYNDLLSYILKTYESKLCRCTTCLILISTYFCPNCFKFGNQTFSQLKEWLKRKNQPI